MMGRQSVTDADVSVELFMAAMPSMKMPEMRNTVPLKHEGGGRYRGTGNVMMTGTPRSAGSGTGRKSAHARCRSSRSSRTEREEGRMSSGPHQQWAPGGENVTPTIGGS
jgi:hypothetical protein